ncbi:MAG: hypothetical protein JXR60_06310 [Bacteroidales bacterium]|nr:hypothetical protein [Bacteroidales bacterium]
MQINTQTIKPYLFIIFTILAFIFYSNTLSHRYALDDAIVITQNDFVQKGLSGIDDILSTELFTGFYKVKKDLVEGGRYRPLSLITFAIEYEYFGESPKVSHFINILLYAFTAWLLFIVLFKLLSYKISLDKGFWVAFVASVIWLAHPLHTEVVANIKGRDEILSLMGALASLWFILNSTKKWYYYPIAGFVFFLGLLAKEMAITFVAIIPISIYFFTESNKKHYLFSIISLLIPTLVFLWIRQSIIGSPSVNGNSIPQELMNFSFLGASPSEKYATIVYTFIIYVKLLFVAYPLTYDYYPYHISLTDWSNPITLISLAFHLLLIYLVIKGFKKKSILAYGILVYALSFSIVSNFFFPIGTFMSERFMFMPSIGFVLILAYYLFIYSEKRLNNPRIVKIGSVVLIATIWGGLTIVRNSAWANDYILFTTDVLTSSNSAKSNTSAGGKTIEEVEKLKTIVNSKPKSIEQITKKLNETDLRSSEKEQLLNGNRVEDVIKNIEEFNSKKLDLALKYLKKAVEIHPTYNDALLLLGNAHFQAHKDFENTWKAYEKILLRNPRFELALKNWTLILNDSIPPAKKIEYHKRLLKYAPNRVENLYQVGHLYGRFLNQLDSSIVYFERAKPYMAKDVRIYKDLGVAYGLSANYEKALENMLQAIKFDPNDKQILINIGVTYQNLDSIPQANYYFQKAQQIK